MRYVFEDYVFDTDRRELHRGSDVVAIAPQVFDLLDYLIRNRERVVTKDDLIRAVWNGRIVSDAALTTRLNAARNAIGDSGEKQRLIKTLPRKGFRFVGAVQEAQSIGALVVADEGDLNRKSVARPEHPYTVLGDELGLGTDDGGAASMPALAPRLSIVVLPFTSIGGDPEQEYFADGVTESLTTDLSRIRSSFVIASSTSFNFKGKAVDVKQVARELKVRYVLEGSVQRSGNRLRINVQLIDAETSNQLWAERFDKFIADLFDMQDEIVSRLANTLDAQLIAAEARRAERSLHPDAMELYFRGIACLHKGLTNEHLGQARSFFERALVLDRDNIEALVGAAAVDFNKAANFGVDDRAVLLATAEATLMRALSLAPQYAEAHMYLGAVHIFMGRVAQGIVECEQALSLDRNLANAHGWIGLAKHFLCHAEETETHVREALRLSPRDVFAHRWMMWAGIASVYLDANAEAVAWLRRSVEANRNFPLAHFHLAVAFALLGSLEEARAAAEAGLALDPAFTIRRFQSQSPSNSPSYLARRERFYAGMRMAGVPEG
ncbi:winged helix-turn-helix domain-containing tetratricopeptide repeat protein [Bradyrhizobium sp. CB2312]|uniref:winged helix-turn-helix domain-containing tetratricopeptide repeat protein n=1 Tax=Bradyrhizobium sp. CB2312 TaxID=3039155 RepID=UPI0024B10F2A|nr:winged helix-turn-helix domain-containing tetratricopeptide repeat protein [Bradyrhizobium sp. CB2312]WFU73957.1 winged helix-turn-helix domain-containing tetratricopeptide repeat protein [Bradyrhizobium sp. CB2312]